MEKIKDKNNQTTEEIIEELCEKYGFKCHFSINIVTISSIYGKWQFDYTMSTYKLWHKPSCIDYKKIIANRNDGYHRQNKSFTDIKELLDYIKCHDKNYVKRGKDIIRKNRKIKNICK